MAKKSIFRAFEFIYNPPKAINNAGAVKIEKRETVLSFLFSCLLFFIPFFTLNLITNGLIDFNLNRWSAQFFLPLEGYFFILEFGLLFFPILSILFYSSFLFAMNQRWRLKKPMNEILFFMSAAFIPLGIVRIVFVFTGYLSVLNYAEKLWFCVLLYALMKFYFKRKPLQSAILALFIPVLVFIGKALLFGIEI
ncbi:MAG: hypothetical protein AAF487_04345 [Bacteroidota bacterium]